LPDLSGLDRGVIEPTYQGKPRYCLLVLDPRATTRIWLVEDGETLHVDRNANGNLTEPGKAFAPSNRREFKSLEDGKEVLYREWNYTIGDLTPAGQPGKHTGFHLVRYQTGDRPAEYVLSGRYQGVTLQYAGWGPLFSAGREQAAVVHFGGPVLPRPLREKELRLNEEGQELHFCIGTPGLGKNSFAFVGYESIPQAGHPVVAITWPTEAGVIEERYRLTHRC
jgi:hypothetical protein